MSETTLGNRLHCLASKRLELVVGILVGVVGVSLLVTNIQAGQSLGEQAWFGAFAIAWVAGLRRFLARRGE